MTFRAVLPLLSLAILGAAAFVTACVDEGPPAPEEEEPEKEVANATPPGRPRQPAVIEEEEYEGKRSAEPGTLLRAGFVGLNSVTSDDYAVYTVRDADGGTRTRLEVMPLGGGEPTVLIERMVSTDVVARRDRVVAFWTKVDPQTRIGELSIWTAAHGVKKVASASSTSFFAATADGTRIAYSVAATAGGTAVAVSDTKPGAAGSVVIPTVGGGCAPRVGFAGGRLFTGTCTTSAAATIRTVGPGETTAKTLLPNAFPDWSASSDGKIVLIRSQEERTATVRTVPDNVSTVIDTGVLESYLAADGKSVLYRTQTGLVKRSPTTNPAPVVLADEVRSMPSVAEDLQHILISSGPPDTKNTSVTRTDLSLVAVSRANAAVPILEKPTGSARGFTGDGRFAVYLTDIGDSGGTGTLRARGVAADAPEKVIGEKVQLPRIVPGSSNAKVAFVDRPVRRSNEVLVDLLVADLAKDGAPAVVMTQVKSYAVTSTKAVYALGKDGGLWAKPLP